MSRSRAGILSGASESILKFGTRKTTMGDIARIGGVAKATLYNHFRDKNELYAALVDAEVSAVIASTADAYASSAGDPFVAALAAAAGAMSEHPVVRRIAENEPAVLGAMLRLDDGRGWLQARAYAATLVGDSGPSSIRGDIALRWVSSHAGWPADADEIRQGATAVARALQATGLSEAVDLVHLADAVDEDSAVARA